MDKGNAIDPTVLVVAGSDSSAGAGMQQDLAVLEHEPVRIACVVTAITAQSNNAVRAVHHVPPQIIEAQFGCAIEQPIAAVKLGMLGTRECVRTILNSLKVLANIPVVLDPVLASSSGYDLVEAEAMELLRSELCRQATLVTPNLPEAALLLGEDEATTDADCVAQARELSQRFQTAVLLKGGHATGKLAVDLLARPGKAIVGFGAERLPASLRGTGCALSSLIAARLAENCDLAEACKRSKEGVGALLRQQLW